MILIALPPAPKKNLPIIDLKNIFEKSAPFVAKYYPNPQHPTFYETLGFPFASTVSYSHLISNDNLVKIAQLSRSPMEMEFYKIDQQSFSSSVKIFLKWRWAIASPCCTEKWPTNERDLRCVKGILPQNNNFIFPYEGRIVNFKSRTNTSILLADRPWLCTI